MPDDPHTGILDRNLFREEIAKSFAGQLGVLEQLVNYGSKLISRCFESSEKGLAEAEVLVSFLKHGVTSIDAIHVLAKEGAVLSCFPHIRTLLEIKLYLKWIFKEDYSRRAIAYYVWNIRKKRYWLRCYIDGTPEQKANALHMKDSMVENSELPLSQKELCSFVEQEDARLNLPEVCEVNELFDQCMKKSGRDKEWYFPFGINGIRDISINLGEEAEYKVFYSKYSELTHGLSSEQQWHFDEKDELLIFDHIRTVESLDEVLSMTFSYSLMLYRLVLERYRPGELEAFHLKYLKEWKSFIQSIPSIKKTEDGFTIDVVRHKESHRA